MSKKPLFFLSLMVSVIVMFLLSLTLVMAQTEQPTVAPTETPPPQVQVALDELNENLSSINEVTFGDLVEYSYMPQDGKTVDNCSNGVENLNNYIVVLSVRNDDGSVSRYSYRVAIKDLTAQRCDYEYFTATPTPTVNLTETTATPTFTASKTPTDTLTPTITLTPTSTRTFTPTRTYTPTSTLTPSVTPRFEDAVTCEGFLTSRLKVGEMGQVLDESLRLRTEASTKGAEVALLQPHASFGVIQGPTCDLAGRAWWQVGYSKFVGWLIEGEGENYYTEPIPDSEYASPTPLPPTRTPMPTREGTQEVVTCPGFMPSRLIIGEQGRVTPGDPNNVRDIPAASGTLMGKIPAGGIFDVLEGPECDPAGRAWWQVDYQGIVGWTVEGQGTDYYVEPVEP